MKISVIMPGHNAAGYLGESLPPLIAMLRREEVAEVLVVDDASLDDSQGVVTGVGARVITIEPNQGPAAARNRSAGGGWECALVCRVLSPDRHPWRIPAIFQKDWAGKFRVGSRGYKIRSITSPEVEHSRQRH